MQARAGTRARIGIGCLVASLATGATGAYAQEGVLRGVVIDKGGAPITDAAVSILALHYATRTDQQGRFIFSNLSRGEAEVSVRRLGYEHVIIQIRLSG